MGSIGEEQLAKMEKMQVANNHEEKILVLVRLRPLSEKEVEANEDADWECINDTTILYRNTLREGSMFPSAYSFDRVFPGDCSTRKLYEEGAKEVALSVVTGINSSIFAYGQTSSGKTYTMMGITEYTVADIFNYIDRHEERAFVLKFSAIEIYNEAIRDLLTTDATPLRLLDDPEKGTVVEKVMEETLKDWNHLQELLSACEAQRHIGETSLNEKSSRSHQILRLTVDSSAREFLGKENSTTLTATVNFVDLAGSERASQAMSSGARLKEGCHINRSLLTLGTVIRKLSKGRHGHINYRDSKLTRLLQPALGGNARTAIICTLSPARSHVEQTRNTLLFACCAKEVTTKAQVNVVMSDKALVKQLQRELARLESELKSPPPASSNCDYAALLRKKDIQIQKMEKEIKELTKQRDLAESRVEDLLRMVGHEKSSRIGSEMSYHPCQQAQDTWEDDCSASESSGVADPNYLNGGVRRFSKMLYDGDRGTNTEESYRLHDNTEDHTFSAGTSSVIGNADDADEYCKEVQCIEMEERGRENNREYHSTGENGQTLALIVSGDAAGADSSSEDAEASHMQSRSTHDLLEQRLNHVQRTIDALVSHPDEQFPNSLEADKLSRRWSYRETIMTGSSSRFDRAEQCENTPPNGLEKHFTGRPEGFRMRFSPLNYDTHTGRLSRNDSQSSLGSASRKTSADEDIPSINTFITGLKEMGKQDYGNELVDGQETKPMADKLERSVKNIGLDPIHEHLETPRNWFVEFEGQQRAIFELWQTCHVSLVHRTYFFLLFKGDPADSIYMQVELRRLSFLKESFYHGDEVVRSDQALTLASSIKVLHCERGVLIKLMLKRFSEEGRKKLYQKWGIELYSKRRRQQLANRLWSNAKDINHIRESAAIVAKLAQLEEAPKEMFGLSFSPPSRRRKSLGWSDSMSFLM